MITKQQQEIVDIVSKTVESLPWRLDIVGGNFVAKTCNYVITVDNPGHYDDGMARIWHNLRIMPREGTNGSFTIVISSYLEKSADLCGQLEAIYNKAMTIAYEQDERVAAIIEELSE